MAITINSFLKRGYTPLACNNYAAIAWQGEYLSDMWMWNGQFTGYKGGVKHIQTVKVTDLKEAAVRFWRDGWTPVKPVDDLMLRRMEEALRSHKGLKAEGVIFPDDAFLKTPESVPVEYLGPEIRVYLGLPDSGAAATEREDALTPEQLEEFRRSRSRT